MAISIRVMEEAALAVVLAEASEVVMEAEAAMEEVAAMEVVLEAEAAMELVLEAAAAIAVAPTRVHLQQPVLLRVLEVDTMARTVPDTQ